MKAFTFTVRDLLSDRLVGHAVVCDAVHFAAVLWSHQVVPTRRVAAADEWRGVERQLADQLAATPLARSSPLLRLLVDQELRSDISVQYVSQRDLQPIVPIDEALCTLLHQDRECVR